MNQIEEMGWGKNRLGAFYYQSVGKFRFKSKNSNLRNEFYKIPEEW